jgi:glutathionylspermidine synthase
VSEVNSDVPGGFTESFHFASRIAEHTGEGLPTGDPGSRWMEAVARSASDEGTVVLLSAPGWVQDTQVVAHLAGRLRQRGLVAHLASPHQLRWVAGRARLETDYASTDVGAVVRFYQAEWVSRLGCPWQPLFVGGRTPVSNPASAVLTESKRLPLAWGELHAVTSTWRRLLPETHDPRDARRLLHDDWVLKPAFGNEGDDVAVGGTMSHARWVRCVARALWAPTRWIAQRRFHVTPLDTPLGPMTVCVGVYVVDGEVCGTYGRLSASPVIDFRAIDAAVLVEGDSVQAQCPVA